MFREGLRGQRPDEGGWVGPGHVRPRGSWVRLGFSLHEMVPPEGSGQRNPLFSMLPFALGLPTLQHSLMGSGPARVSSLRALSGPFQSSLLQPDSSEISCFRQVCQGVGTEKRAKAK